MLLKNAVTTLLASASLGAMAMALSGTATTAVGAHLYTATNYSHYHGCSDAPGVYQVHSRINAFPSGTAGYGGVATNARWWDKDLYYQTTVPPLTKDPNTATCKTGNVIQPNPNSWLTVSANYPGPTSSNPARKYGG